MATKTKRANGIDIQVYDHDDSQTLSRARQVASLLPRDCDAVHRIVTGIGDDMANVWLADGGSVSLDIPDGLAVEDVFVARTGRACLTIVRDE